MSEDQKLKEQDDGRVLLEARVLDTMEIRQWLLGFGDQVEVVKPKKLRDDIRDTVLKLVKIYN